MVLGHQQLKATLVTTPGWLAVALLAFELPVDLAEFDAGQLLRQLLLHFGIRVFILAKLLAVDLLQRGQERGRAVVLDGEGVVAPAGDPNRARLFPLGANDLQRTADQSRRGVGQALFAALDRQFDGLAGLRPAEGQLQPCRLFDRDRFSLADQLENSIADLHARGRRGSSCPDDLHQAARPGSELSITRWPR